LPLPAHYGCLALPSSGGAAVLDLTVGQERLLGYVRPSKLAAPVVACGNGRLLIASRDNNNLYIYDIADALTVGEGKPLAAPNSFGLRTVAVLDAGVRGLAYDREHDKLYVSSHSERREGSYDLLTVIEQRQKRLSLQAGAEPDSSLSPSLNPDGSRLVVPTKDGRLLTMDTASYQLSSRPLLTATVPPTLTVAGAESGSYRVDGNTILPRYVAPSTDGAYYYLSVAEGVAVVEGGSGRLLRTVRVMGAEGGLGLVVARLVLHQRLARQLAGRQQLQPLPILQPARLDQVAYVANQVSSLVFIANGELMVGFVVGTTQTEVIELTDQRAEVGLAGLLTVSGGWPLGFFVGLSLLICAP